MYPTSKQLFSSTQGLVSHNIIFPVSKPLWVKTDPAVHLHNHYSVGKQIFWDDAKGEILAFSIENGRVRKQNLKGYKDYLCAPMHIRKQKIRGIIFLSLQMTEEGRESIHKALLFL
jgi:hypothetical protein